jgi:hypothetical protein
MTSRPYALAFKLACAQTLVAMATSGCVPPPAAKPSRQSSSANPPDSRNRSARRPPRATDQSDAPEDDEREQAPPPQQQRHTTSDSEIEAFIKAHPKLPASRKKLLRERTTEIGMTKDEIELLYGEPAQINRTGGTFGIHEQWVYPDSNEYLYFENGKLTAWQD